MGQLIPEDFDFSLLKNDSEREVVRALRDQLSDDWRVIPNFLFNHEHRDHEIDVIVMHPDWGIGIIEVKGHKARIRGGKWYAGGEPMVPQPFDQARDNAYSLRNMLRQVSPTLFERLQVPYAVAFPNMSRVEGHETREFKESQLLLEPQISDLRFVIENLFIEEAHLRFPVDGIEEALRIICPDIDFEYDPHATAKRARDRLEEVSLAQIRAMETLDDNRRVIVTGKAGTGKTRLAIRWAQRAIAREERVLFVCFNEPLAQEVRARMNIEDEDVVIGPFLQVARQFQGVPWLDEPEDASDEELKYFWDVTMVGHLHAHWPHIEDTFDTIVVDEAQDFSPAWIAQLEALLDPDGPRRLLLVGDASQDIFERGYRLPSSDDGWTSGELVTNCRNTLQIARLLRSVLDGSAAPQTSPDSFGISFIATSEEKAAVVDSVQVALDGCPLGESVVITASRRWRNDIRDALGLGTFEDRHQRTPCESVRRLKGTEFDTVVLVDPSGELDDQGLSIGISRAVNKLVIIGPAALGRRLRLIST